MLYKTCFIAPEVFSDSQRPMILIAANNQRVAGGSREVVVSICLRGVVDSGGIGEFEIPTRLYEAGIGEDVLLSYALLVTRPLDVLSAWHGLSGPFAAQNFVIPGMLGPENPAMARIFGKPLLKINSVPSLNVLKALDLCGGSGSASRVLRDHGFEVTTLYSDRSGDATLLLILWNGIFEGNFPLDVLL